MGRKSVVVLAAAIVLVGLAWLASRSPAGDVRDAAAPSAARDGAASAPAVVLASGALADAPLAETSHEPPTPTRTEVQAPAASTATRARGGTIAGRIVDPAGIALSGANVAVRRATGGASPIVASSARDGRFRVPVPEDARYEIVVRLRGFATTRRRSAVDEVPSRFARVERGATHELGDVELTPVPWLAGVVRDDSGRPLANARVAAFPKGAHEVPSGESDGLGDFYVELFEDVPHRLEASLEGYLSAPLSDRAFAPGSDGIELVLRELPLARFRVVDAASGAPIDGFGLAIHPGWGSEARRWPTGRVPRLPSPLAFDSSGTVERRGRPGLDAYVACAAGYLDELGDVLPEAAHLQTIRMRRGSSVRGRFVAGGRPLADIEVAVETAPRDEYGPARLELADLGRTDAEGAFAFRALEAGSYVLRASPRDGAASEHLVEVDGVLDLDLGDLTLAQGATVEGVVLLPHGLAARDVEVALTQGTSTRKTRLDRDARFRFEHAARGAATLAVSPIADALAPGVSVEVVLEGGATRHVTLDAVAQALCVVELTILVAGEPPRRAIVQHHEDGKAGSGAGHAADAAGRVRIALRAAGFHVVTVEIDDALVIHPERLANLPPLGRVERTLSFELGELVLDVPIDLTPHVGTMDFVRLVLDGPAGSTQCLAECTEARTLTFTHVPAGTWDARVELFSAATLIAPGREGAEGFEWPAPVWTSGTRVTTRAGRSTRAGVE